MQGGRTLGEPLFLDKQAGGVPFGAMNAVRRELRVEWNELLLDWSAEPSLAARLLNGRRQSPPAVEAGRLDRSLNARGAAVHCPKPPLPKVDTFTDLHDEEPPIAVAFFPLSAKAGEGSLLVVHDLSFIDRRAHEAEFYMALALIGVAAGLGLLATAIVLALLRGWNRSLRQAIDNFNLVAQTMDRDRRKCRSGGISRRCCPNSGSSGNTPTAFMWSGRPTRSISFSTRSCPERR